MGCLVNQRDGGQASGQNIYIQWMAVIRTPYKNIPDIKTIILKTVVRNKNIPVIRPYIVTPMGVLISDSHCIMLIDLKLIKETTYVCVIGVK